MNGSPNIACVRGGRQWFSEFGIDVDTHAAVRAPLCRQCLDWSERRTHLAGSLGRAVFSRLLALRWLRRLPNSRALNFSSRGIAEFDTAFPLP